MKSLIAPKFFRRYFPPMPTRKLSRVFLLSFVAALAGGGFALEMKAADTSGVKMVQTNDRVRVEINGELFTEYFFKMRQHPALMTDRNGNTTTNPTRHTYFYPLIGPGGLNMTRSWPMKP